MADEKLRQDPDGKPVVGFVDASGDVKSVSDANPLPTTATLSGTITVGAVQIRDADSPTEMVDVEAVGTGALTTTLKAMVGKVKAFLADSLGNLLTSKDEGGGVRSLDVNIRSGSIGGASANWYFSNETELALTTAYQEFSFGFDSTNFILQNDGASGLITASWNGASTTMVLSPWEAYAIDDTRHSSIYIKGEFGGEKYKLMVW